MKTIEEFEKAMTLVENRTLWNELLLAILKQFEEISFDIGRIRSELETIRLRK